jgi:para-nitrobenzyl esterase
VEAFGGDPARVTVGGESAGAKLTDILMGVPSAEGLFHQMISESGGAERVWLGTGSAAVAKGFGEDWQTDSGKALASLRTAPAMELVETQTRFIKNWPQHFPLRVEIDGKLVPRLPVETIAAGSTRGKRLLIGTNCEESALFVGPHPAHDAMAADLGNMGTGRFAEIYAKYSR